MSQCQAAWRSPSRSTASSMLAEQDEARSCVRTPFWVSSRLAPAPSAQLASRTATTRPEALRASASRVMARSMRCSGVMPANR